MLAWTNSKSTDGQKFESMLYYHHQGGNKNPGHYKPSIVVARSIALKRRGGDRALSIGAGGVSPH